MNNESPAKLICRKCGGPHFTIKCGKEIDKINTEPEKINTEPKKDSEINTNIEIDEKIKFKPRRDKHYSKTYRVKLSELPKDSHFTRDAPSSKVLVYF